MSQNATTLLANGLLIQLETSLEREKALREALTETWRVLRAAGTLNLSRGVQLGQTSWYVKISDAEALSDAALSVAPQSGVTAHAPREAS